MNTFKAINEALIKTLNESKSFRPGELDFIGSAKSLRADIKKNYKDLDKWLDDNKIEFIRIEDSLDLESDSTEEFSRPVGYGGHDYYPSSVSQYVSDIQNDDFEIEYYTTDSGDESLFITYKELEKENEDAANELIEFILDLANEELE
jgi:hypothetical protein